MAGCVGRSYSDSLVMVLTKKTSPVLCDVADSQPSGRVPKKMRRCSFAGEPLGRCAFFVFFLGDGVMSACRRAGACLRVGVAFPPRG